jgi:hypothetical protein
MSRTACIEGAVEVGVSAAGLASAPGGALQVAARPGAGRQFHDRLRQRDRRAIRNETTSFLSPCSRRTLPRPPGRAPQGEPAPRCPGTRRSPAASPMTSSTGGRGSRRANRRRITEPCAPRPLQGSTPVRTSSAPAGATSPPACGGGSPLAARAGPGPATSTMPPRSRGAPSVCASSHSSRSSEPWTRRGTSTPASSRRRNASHPAGRALLAPITRVARCRRSP